MKVKELIEQLNAVQDKDLDVISGYDNYFFPISGVQKRTVCKGKLGVGFYPDGFNSILNTGVKVEAIELF